MEKRWIKDDKKIMVVVLFIIVVTTLFFTVLKPEKEDMVLPPTQPEIQKTVVWYTSLPNATAEKLANAFQLKTDNEIRVVVKRGATYDMVQLVSDEIEEDNVTADVFHVADMAIFMKLKENGDLLYYNSPEYAFYPGEYKDEGYWAAMRVIAVGMAYDSSRITDPPKHWIDLLDPKWKGKIGLKNILGGTAYAQYYLLRDLLGKAYWEDLSKNEPFVYDNYNLLGEAALEGDIDIIGEFSIYKTYTFSVKKGTTIKGIYPDEGIPMVPCPVAIIKDAKHPEEAKLFVDFLLSKEGQEIVQRTVGTYSARFDVEPLEGKPPLKDLNQLLPESWKEYEEEKETLQAEFRELFEME